MQVSLEAIKFNHDPHSATADALNIRRNETETVFVPEWRNGVSILPDDSPAAYARDAIGENPITIKAKFKCLDPKIKSVEVRAIDPARNVEALSASEGNAIGEVAEREITFDANGETEFESFELINVDIHNRGVSSGVSTLIWQCRLRHSDPWSNLTTTSHRIYTLLDVPNCAWRQQPFDGLNIQLPWTEVLDYACQWASGAQGIDEAAGRITQAVFDLGRSLVIYDGPSTYADLTFDCTSLLNLLHDDKGLGQTLNCSDCATIVSTFANAVGCDLWQSRIGTSFFITNPIRLIGEPDFDNVDFEYHEVAWKDECSFDNDLFDACLQVDADEDPSKPPQTGVLAIQTKFGSLQKGNYRFQLAPPPKHGEVDVCKPTPNTRQRRAIGLNSTPQKDCTELSSGAEPQSNEPVGNTPQIFSGNVKFEDWDLYRVRTLKKTADLLFGACSLWYLPAGDPEHLIRLDISVHGTPAAATREKQRLLERYQVRDAKQDLKLSAIDFIIITKRAFLGQVDEVVIEVRSVGRKAINIGPFAHAVSQMI